MDFEALKEIATKQELVDYTILQKAVYACSRAYNDEQTATRLKDWHAARDAFAKLVEGLDQKYGQDGEGQSAERSFPNKLEAHRWLKSEGWQVSRSAFYLHCKEGRVRPGKDGRFYEGALVKYSRLHLRQVETGKKVGEADDELRRKREEADLRRALARAERDEYELAVTKGGYIERVAHQRELTVALAAMDALARQYLHGGVARWIAACGGDETRTADLLALMLEEYEAAVSRLSFESLLVRVLSGAEEVEHAA